MEGMICVDYYRLGQWLGEQNLFLTKKLICYKFKSLVLKYQKTHGHDGGGGGDGVMMMMMVVTMTIMKMVMTRW
jgi:hypothetical protein